MMIKHVRGVTVVGLVLLLCGQLGCGGKEGAKSEPLLCYVGGTMRPAMEELARIYKQRTGQEVQLDYADSGQLLIKIEQTRQGDLYVCHDPFLGALMRKGLGGRGWAVASLTPVIVVRKANNEIKGLRDLAKPGVKVVVTHPTYSTAGHIVTVMATKAGIVKELDANTVSRPRSGNEAANAVTIGTADAAICWNAVAFLQREKLKAVDIEPEFRPAKDVDVVTTATFGRIDMDYVKVTIATLACSKQEQAAAAFAEFVASPEGRQVWDRSGFSPVDPARSAELTPARKIGGSLLIHCAAGMRPPVSTLAEEFGRERGVKMAISYGGSNFLLAQIELRREGDVYIAGDADYVQMADKKGFVKSRKTICYFVPVILVAKNNPLGIKSLADLTKDGVYIGQGDEKAAAVGRIMPRLLELNGVDAAAWKKNLKVEAPTVNDLGVKVQLGTIHAAVVWDAIAWAFKGKTDSVRIDRAKNVCPEVEAAALTMTQNAEAAGAFLEFLASPRGRAVLAANGYTVDKP